jgi:hypothetical protein
MTTTYDDIEAQIEEFFHDNFEMLRMEGGHSLSPEVKLAALRQTLLYWRRLKDEVAKHVTDTEVKLTLPEQLSPRGRKFAIEGVVDIVREKGRTTMYDVKTHEPEYILAHKEEYRSQLNVYAHIWQNLQQQTLDETAVIATVFPEPIKKALDNDDDALLERELPKWNPLIDIEFDPHDVQQTIADFGAVVDWIEDGDFAPPPAERLKKPFSDSNKRLFATQVCINCDARFSCASYRAFALSRQRPTDRGHFYRYFQEFTDEERESRLLAVPDTDQVPDVEELL